MFYGKIYGNRERVRIRSIYFLGDFQYMSDEVNKVTLYMTPEQWRAMSAWNIKHLEKGEETWLFLSHESDRREEYLAELARYKEDVDRAIHVVYPKDPA
jgi:hypothetical protein